MKKLNPIPMPFLAAAGLALTFASNGGAAPAKAPEESGATRKAVQAKLTSAELMSTAYIALIRQSIVPIAPRLVAAAALAEIHSLAPGQATPLPAAFGADTDVDAAWLADRVRDLPTPWSVVDAMVRAANTAHLALATPQRRQGMGARVGGHPLSEPGFNIHPLRDGRFVVFDVTQGASAEASGLRVGDVLVRVDGRPTQRYDHFLINTLPAGTSVTLDIERSNRPAVITLRLSEAGLPPVESRLLEDGIAYVRIRWFARSDDAERDTAAIARRAFTELADQGARGLILDLRSALGGTGEVNIISALCDGEVVYAFRPSITDPARPVLRSGTRCWPDQPIAILMNEHTISAGEFLALSVRELTHATIVGQRSGGGLTKISFFPLADGYALAVPTGVVLGPVTGEVQPHHAIRPDIEVPNPEIADLMNGHDPQLDAARAAVKLKRAAR